MPALRLRAPAVVALLALLLPTAAAAQQGGAADARRERQRFRDATAYSRAHGGDAVLVLRGDSVVFESYHNGYRAGEPHPVASGTKGFTCALAVAAAQDGLLSLDEPVARALPEMEGSMRGAITVRHLLSLTSGLEPNNRLPDGREPDDHYANAALLPLRAAPGTRWAYGDGPFDLFGALLRRRLAATGEDPLAYLERRVLRPIGVSGHQWVRDRAGSPLFAGGARLTAREWARFGRLVRDSGRWEGSEVLPAAGLRECFRGSAARPDYGLGWWLNPAGPAGTPLVAGHPDLVAQLGYGNQGLFVLPSRDLVVVRLGGPHPLFRVGEFLARLLGEPVPPRATPAP